jgi:hypothetical protein
MDPVLLTYEKVFLLTTVFEPSRPQAVLLVEICLEFSWEVKKKKYCTKVARANIIVQAVKHA